MISLLFGYEQVAKRIANIRLTMDAVKKSACRHNRRISRFMDYTR